MVRSADYNIFTKAGPEIGVASTKAFTAQMAVLLAIALKAAEQKVQILIEENGFQKLESFDENDEP